MVQPVRTLKRGLDVLRALNARNGGSLRDIATATGLSRGAVHRLLETMVDEGYIRKNSDFLYFVEPKTRMLASTLDVEGWLDSFAQETIDNLCRDVSWPILVATPRGLSMQAGATTDRLSPLRFNAIPVGMRLPIMGTAAGRTYLAFSTANRRNLMLELMAKQAEFPEDQKICQDPAAAKAMLRAIREAGGAIAERMKRTSVLAVPIQQADGEVLGSLSLRFFSSSLTSKEVMKRYMEKMQVAATVIANHAPQGVYRM